MSKGEIYYDLKIKDLQKSDWSKPGTLLAITGLLFSISIATYEKINGIGLNEQLSSFNLNIKSKDEQIAQLVEESQSKEIKLIQLKNRFDLISYESNKLRSEITEKLSLVNLDESKAYKMTAEINKLAAINVPVPSEAVPTILNPQESIELKVSITKAGKTFWLQKQKYDVKLSIDKLNEDIDLNKIDSVTYLLGGFSGDNPIVKDGPNFNRTISAFMSFPVTIVFRYEGTTYEITDYVDVMQ